MPAHYRGGWDESARHRAELPAAKVVFLLVNDSGGGALLICPWQRRPRGALSSWQAARLAEVRTVLQQLPALPEVAWISAADGLWEFPEAPEGAWLRRRLHDGQIVPAAG